MKARGTADVEMASESSFVIRMWQEEPGLWRGRIRHVQSEAQRALRTPAEAAAFIAKQSRYRAPDVARTQPPSIASTRTHRRLPIPFGRGLRFASAVAALVIVGAVALVLSGPGANAPLQATAVGDGVPGELLAFAVGLALGALGMALATRTKLRR